MVDEAVNKIPYQKGTIALSLLVLIYGYGQGELSPSLTIALVGLTLNKPQVLEVFVLAALVWYTWRFYVTGQWDVRSYAASQSTYTLTHDKGRDDWNIMSSSSDLPYKDFMTTTYPQGEYHLQNSQVSGVCSRFLELNFEQFETGNKEKFTLKVPRRKGIKAEFQAAYRWLLTEDDFAHRYLPMGLAITALFSALIHKLVGI